jgi:hypothetical protein
VHLAHRRPRYLSAGACRSPVVSPPHARVPWRSPRVPFVQFLRPQLAPLPPLPPCHTHPLGVALVRWWRAAHWPSPLAGITFYGASFTLPIARLVWLLSVGGAARRARTRSRRGRSSSTHAQSRPFRTEPVRPAARRGWAGWLAAALCAHELGRTEVDTAGTRPAPSCPHWVHLSAFVLCCLLPSESAGAGG